MNVVDGYDSDEEFSFNPCIYLSISNLVGSQDWIPEDPLLQVFGLFIILFYRIPNNLEKTIVFWIVLVTVVIVLFTRLKIVKHMKFYVLRMYNINVCLICSSILKSLIMIEFLMNTMKLVIMERKKFKTCWKFNIHRFLPS